MQTVPLRRNYDASLRLWTAANFFCFFVFFFLVALCTCLKSEQNWRADWRAGNSCMEIWEQTYLWKGNAWSSLHAVAWPGLKASEHKDRIKGQSWARLPHIALPYVNDLFAIDQLQSKAFKFSGLLEGAGSSPGSENAAVNHWHQCRSNHKESGHIPEAFALLETNSLFSGKEIY